MSSRSFRTMCPLMLCPSHFIAFISLSGRFTFNKNSSRQKLSSLGTAFFMTCFVVAVKSIKMTARRKTTTPARMMLEAAVDEISVFLYFTSPSRGTVTLLLRLRFHPREYRSRRWSFPIDSKVRLLVSFFYDSSLKSCEDKLLKIEGTRREGSGKKFYVEPPTGMLLRQSHILFLHMFCTSRSGRRRRRRRGALRREIN